MKGLLVRLEDDLAQRFTVACEAAGYSKTGLMVRWVREFVASAGGAGDAIAAARAYGIDLSLIAQNLRRSPTERLQAHAQAHVFASRLRKAGARRD